MQITYSPTGKTLRGPRAEEDFTVETVQTPLAVGGSAGSQTIKDVTYTTAIGAGQDNNFRVILPADAAIQNETPAVCAVDAAGNVNRLTDGLASVVVSTPGLGSRRYQQQMQRIGSTTVNTGVSSLATGSLLKYLTDQRNAILAASTPNAVHQRAFLNADGSGGINPANMLLRTDVPGFTPLNLSPILAFGYRYITPKHRIFTYHTNPSQYWGANIYGMKLPQMADTGIVYEKNTNRAASDICKLLPVNWRDYLPTAGSNVVDLPVWVRRTWVGAKDSGEKFWIQAASDNAGIEFAPVDTLAATFAHPTDGSMGVGGDSGSPVFIGINGQTVLYGHLSWFGGGMDFGYGSYADNISVINTALVATATAGGDPNPSSYAVQTIDLSGFTSY